ncbi:putative disease resistance protein RGA3 [Miscanthus floridulus]|uniref:putative disease resistance protein RGA3 n=1 Tax=Miscanthus floridulus TaxID=154761 RepID=UPI003457A957
MAMFLSSILSELTSRSISFLMDKCSRQLASPPTVEETLSNLQRLLPRVHVIVEEADERHISNQAMLRQLGQLRKEMYRGYHTLDTFRCRSAHEENRVSRSISSPAKRIRFSSDSNSSEQEQLKLLEIVGCLEGAIRDMSEFVVFLSGCPRRCRQPYSMYLIVDHCMFGRQMEMARIKEFLLQEEVPIDGNPGVLPIVAPGKLGKSTLIEHACNNERVCNRFSQNICFRQCDTRDERTVASLSDCDVIKHRSRAMGEERILVIIELIGGMDEDVWRKFYSDCKRHVAGGSKIIVASRSDKIARFGTTQPLEIKFLTPEEYWYFFKVRMFGSTDPEGHPKLASIAMDLARETNGKFFTVSVLSSLLRANFDAHFWSMALARIRKFKRINPLLYGEKHVDFWQGLEPINVPRVNKTSSEYLVILHGYETGFVQDTAQNEPPQISIRDVLFGSNSVIPCGRFEVVVRRSHIPPHYSYMWDCEVRRPQGMVSRRKRI